MRIKIGMWLLRLALRTLPPEIANFMEFRRGYILAIEYEERQKNAYY